MAIFSRRHYEAVAQTLGESTKDDALIVAFIRLFEKDNIKFDAKVFVEAVIKARRS